MAIAELRLEGGFQHYRLLLGGAPFGARTRVAEHAAWRDGCALLLEDVGDGDKPVGHT